MSNESETSWALHCGTASVSPTEGAHLSGARNHISVRNLGVSDLTGVCFALTGRIRAPLSQGFLTADALYGAESPKPISFKRSNAQTRTSRLRLCAAEEKKRQHIQN